LTFLHKPIAFHQSAILVLVESFFDGVLKHCEPFVRIRLGIALEQIPASHGQE